MRVLQRHGCALQQTGWLRSPVRVSCTRRCCATSVSTPSATRYAFGMGIERLTMRATNVTISALFDNDLRFLQQFA